MRSMKWSIGMLALAYTSGCTSHVRMDAGPEDAGAARDSGQQIRDSGPPDAGPEPCDTAGAARIVACGNCGEQSQQCTEDLFWIDNGPCIGENECPAGTVETEDFPNCSQRARLCSATCEWGEWDEVVAPRGECEVGETRTRRMLTCRPWEVITDVCNDTCEWDLDPSGEGCVEACGGTARTTPPEAEERCIPAGLFVRGDDDFSDAVPVREVYLSSYYLDRFPATNRRFRECVDAGACVAPTEYTGALVYARESASDDPVVGITWERARDFCAWDGRRLPTEAELEKAGRGHVPRSQPYLWDGEEYRCDLLYSGLCGFRLTTEQIDAGWSVGRFDSLPGTRSYYGIEMLHGAGGAWASDYYQGDYYADDSSLVDPAGPSVPPGPAHVARGAFLQNGSEGEFNVAHRSATGYTVRCARSVP